MFETMAEMYPERADESTAGATMEWFNIHQCEEFGHAAGVHVSLEEAEKLGREGAELARKNSFETLAKMAMKEKISPSQEIFSKSCSDICCKSSSVFSPPNLSFSTYVMASPFDGRLSAGSGPARRYSNRRAGVHPTLIRSLRAAHHPDRMISA
jgi:hypothetical protein